MVDVTGLDLTTPVKKKNGTTAQEYENVSEADLQLLEGLGFVRRDGDGSLTLIAPVKGATTSSVKRTRCELKVSGNGLDLSKYKTFVVKFVGIVEAINYEQSVVLFQLHCKDGNDPTVKFFLEDGVLKEGTRDYAKPTDPKKRELLKVGYTLPLLIEGEIRVDSETRKLTVSAGHGDSKVSHEYTLAPERFARPHVPHWGVYNQVDQGLDGEPAGDKSAVKLIDIYYGELQAPVPEKTPAQLLDAELDKLLFDYKAGTIGLGAAKLQLNDISNRIKSIPDEDERYALNVKAKAVKGQLV